MTFFGRAAGDACRRGGDALEKGRKGGYSSGGLAAEAALAQGEEEKPRRGKTVAGCAGKRTSKAFGSSSSGLPRKTKSRVPSLRRLSSRSCRLCSGLESVLLRNVVSAEGRQGERD